MWERDRAPDRPPSAFSRECHWSRAGTPAPYAGNGSAIRAGPLGLLLLRASLPSLGWLESRAGSPIWILAAPPERWRLRWRVSIAVREGPVVPRQFLNEIAAAVEQDDMAFAAGPAELRRVDLALARGSSPAAAPEQPGSRLSRVAGHLGLRGTQRHLEPVRLPSLPGRLLGNDVHGHRCWRRHRFDRGDGGSDERCTLGDPRRLPRGLLGRLTDRGEWGAGELTAAGEGLRRDIVGMKLWLQRVILAGDPDHSTRYSVRGPHATRQDLSGRDRNRREHSAHSIESPCRRFARARSP